MARQEVVRALVETGRLENVMDHLLEEAEVDPDTIEVVVPEPATYRDEAPDLELRKLVRAGRIRVAIGAVVGGLLGAAVAVAVPALRDFAPVSVLLLAFGGAWGTGAVVAARAVQVHRHEGPRGEKVHEVGPGDVERYRLMTIRDVHDRTAIIDELSDMGVVLLDSQHPRVGRGGRGERPAEPGSNDMGPPAP